jgi:hypothetical protein
MATELQHSRPCACPRNPGGPHFDAVALMAAGKSTASNPSQRKGPGRGYARRTHALVAERDRRMAEIAAMYRDGPEPGSFLDKAQTLLTRRWSSASWSARAGILVTVDWLFRMERLRTRS